jgi:hypothetical protein
MTQHIRIQEVEAWIGVSEQLEQRLHLGSCWHAGRFGSCRLEFEEETAGGEGGAGLASASAHRARTRRAARSIVSDVSLMDDRYEERRIQALQGGRDSRTRVEAREADARIGLGLTGSTASSAPIDRLTTILLRDWLGSGDALGGLMFHSHLPELDMSSTFAAQTC